MLSSSSCRECLNIFMVNKAEESLAQQWYHDGCSILGPLNYRIFTTWSGPQHEHAIRSKIFLKQVNVYLHQGCTVQMNNRTYS